MTQPSEREREWLKRIAGNHDLCFVDMDGEPCYDDDALAALSEVLVKTKEACVSQQPDPLMLPDDQDAAHMYKVAWADYQQTLRDLEVTGE